VLLKKVFLPKLNFFIFSHSLPGGLIRLLSNAVVVCRPLSSFPLVVRCLILCAVILHHLRCPPLSSSTAAVVVIHRCCCTPPPSSAAAAVIATPCLRHLLPPALVLPLCSLPPNLACHCHPPLLLSAFSVVIQCRHLPPPQPSSPLCSLRRLSPPALILPHHSLLPNHECCCRLPLSSSATIVVRLCCTSTHPPFYKMLIVA
jgi:hypothetical protein